MDSSGNVLAIDIGGSKLITGIVDPDGKVLCSLRSELHRAITAADIIRAIEYSTDILRQNHPNHGFSAAGATIPGLADPRSGVWIYACFSQIKDFNISGILSDKLNVPVYIDNDVNACALAERYYGCCRSTYDFVWVTVSNGVGGALFLNGGLYYGSSLNAGEIGHFNVEENAGLPCGCGNFGCLEAMAAGPGIVRRYLAAAKMGDSSISAKDIADLAKKGDRIAIEVYAKTGYYLGKALSYAVNLMNCEKIVLGGGVSQAMELFLPELKATMNRMIFRDANKYITIEQTALGYDAGLIGAAALARRGGKH